MGKLSTEREVHCESVISLSINGRRGTCWSRDHEVVTWPSSAHMICYYLFASTAVDWSRLMTQRQMSLLWGHWTDCGGGTAECGSDFMTSMSSSTGSGSAKPYVSSACTYIMRSKNYSSRCHGSAIKLVKCYNCRWFSGWLEKTWWNWVLRSLVLVISCMNFQVKHLFLSWDLDKNSPLNRWQEQITCLRQNIV